MQICSFTLPCILKYRYFINPEEILYYLIYFINPEEILYYLIYFINPVEILKKKSKLKKINKKILYYNIISVEVSFYSYPLYKVNSTEIKSMFAEMVRVM